MRLLCPDCRPGAPDQRQAEAEGATEDFKRSKPADDLHSANLREGFGHPAEDSADNGAVK